jgi:hypothetical protein
MAEIRRELGNAPVRSVRYSDVFFFVRVAATPMMAINATAATRVSE